MLADVGRVEGPKMISREWSKRRITVQCNVRGRDIGSFIAEAQKKVAAAVKLPQGYTIEWGGQFENMQRAQKRLMIVVPLALGLIIVLLYVTYKNVTDTMCVFASVPLACIGGIMLLVDARHADLDLGGGRVHHAVGRLGAQQHGVCLGISRLAARRHRARPRRSCTAAMTRLRTVMMTALVASVGFAPMALSTGMGAEVQRPLATVVIGGVISSTLMTLFVMPALYRLLVRDDPAAARSNSASSWAAGSVAPAAAFAIASSRPGRYKNATAINVTFTRRPALVNRSGTPIAEGPHGHLDRKSRPRCKPPVSLPSRSKNSSAASTPATQEVSIARMTSPSGWVEPGQKPEFDEYTLVLRGTLHLKLAAQCGGNRRGAARP